MAWVTIGIIAAATDAFVASLLSSATASRTAVDNRINVRSKAEVADAVANDPSVVQAAANAAAGIAGLVKYRRALSADANLDMMRNQGDEGPWIVASSTAAALGLGDTAGILWIYWTGSTGAVQIWEPLEGDPSRRGFTNGAWGSWLKTIDFIALNVMRLRYALPVDTDMDALEGQAAQGFYIVSASLASDSGMGSSSGILSVLWLGTPGTIQEFEPINGESKKRRFNGSIWSRWMDPHADYGLRNDLLKADFSRRIGVVTTGGKAAVALRFDHGLTNFASKIRPLLQARGFKSTIAMNSRTWSSAENSGVSAATADNWADVEFANHSATHNDAPNRALLEDEIISGLTELQAQLPKHKIDGWIMPGVGGSEYAGWGTGSPVESFADHYAGRLILGHHAWSTGSVTGTVLQPLDGVMRDGSRHYTLDQSTVAAAKTQIDAAIAARAGVTLMMHPSLLDGSGYMTTAQLTEVLDYLAARQAAGELVVLSMSELMLADAGPGAYATAVLTSGASSGAVSLEKVGGTVTASFSGVVKAGSSEHVATHPDGFGPPNDQGHGWVADTSGGWWPAMVTPTQILVLGPPPAGTVLNGSLIWKAV